jgi:hypothetical protein
MDVSDSERAALRAEASGLSIVWHDADPEGLGYTFYSLNSDIGSPEKEAKESKEGKEGSNGVPGRQGGAGGSFTMIAEDVHETLLKAMSPENPVFRIKSIGGTGGKGQGGQDGGPGGHRLAKLKGDRRQDRYNSYPFVYHQLVLAFHGAAGGPGGEGGPGGRGGNGGNVTVSPKLLEAAFETDTSVGADGQRGADGTSGTPGRRSESEIYRPVVGSVTKWDMFRDVQTAAGVYEGWRKRVGEAYAWAMNGTKPPAPTGRTCQHREG